jgi:hypothetical protein
MHNAADNVSQAEGRRIMAEERRGRTYMGQAQHMEPELGGRFAKVNTTTVTGATPGSVYPTQPANSPWNNDPCPPEPSLGYSVEDQEPIGEMFERGSPAAPGASDTSASACEQVHVVGAGGVARKFPRRA